MQECVSSQLDCEIPKRDIPLVFIIVLSTQQELNKGIQSCSTELSRQIQPLKLRMNGS